MLTYTTWIEEKITLALSLAQGSCGGTYADGAIILCTSISAMSSLMWIKTKNTDRKRFIEIIVQFNNNGIDITNVSCPLLSQDKIHQNKINFKKKLGISDIAYRYTSANDKTEKEIIDLFSSIISPHCAKILSRRYSYANLLYEHIRCGFIHNYATTEFATSYDCANEIFDDGAPIITYVNYLSSPIPRKIHFPLEWISEVAKNVAAGMDSQCSHHNKYLGENIDLAAPRAWWIDGA